MESERARATFEQQAALLEMQALRAQMNPHFIFNCLNSVNRFILRNDAEAASDYLTKFSRLIRMVLNNSKKTMISLEDELECLRLYIQMEQLRFRSSFFYSVNIDENVNPDEMMVPPLVLQPFVENAIWHGLMNLPDQQSAESEKGKITIDISVENGKVKYCVQDNGVGRKKAAELNAGKEKRQSLGLHITKERIKFFGNGDQDKTAIEARQSR